LRSSENYVAEPVIVTIPHRLGKEEAVRRLKTGFAKLHSGFGAQLAVVDDNWTGDHLDFRATILGQTTSGTVDVGEADVRPSTSMRFFRNFVDARDKAGHDEVKLRAKRLPDVDDLDL
jgi:hypothetical protein